MLNTKLSSLFLFTALVYVQTAFAARTIVACAASPLPAGSFIVGSGTECDDTCAGRMALYSLYQPSTQSCVCNNVGISSSVYFSNNRVNFVCDPSRPTGLTVTRLVGTFTYAGCVGGGSGTVVQPTRNAAGNFETIFSTCAGFKYVAISRINNVQNQAICMTDFTNYTPVGFCSGQAFQLYTHPPGATVSGYARKRRQMEVEKREAEVNKEAVNSEHINTLLEGEQGFQDPESTPNDFQAQFALVTAQASCPMGLTACAVPSVSGSEAGYECIDVESELESCGGCLHGVYQGPNIQSIVNGTDCSASPNVALSGVTCRAGKCHISACDYGFTLTDGRCV